MTSAERAIEYTNVGEEVQSGTTNDSWPSKGSVSFKEVTLTYQGCKNSVLKNISFEVESKEKIGVIGRTGAGKSSILSVLYRLYEFDGCIEVDGIDTKTQNLKHLRWVIEYRQCSVFCKAPSCA